MLVILLQYVPSSASCTYAVHAWRKPPLVELARFRSLKLTRLKTENVARTDCLELERLADSCESVCRLLNSDS